MDIQVSNAAKAVIGATAGGQYITVGSKALGMFAGAVKLPPELLNEPYFLDASKRWKPFPTDNEPIDLSTDGKKLVSGLLGAFSLDALPDPGGAVDDLKFAWGRVKKGHTLPIDYVKVGVALGDLAANCMPLPREAQLAVNLGMACGALFVLFAEVQEMNKSC